MSEFYIEQLVQKKVTLKDVLLRGVILGLAVTSLFLSLTFMPYLMLLTVVMFFLTNLMFRRTNLEYEYLCLNGDLDIDKVIAKSKRKQVISVKMEEVEWIMPTNHPEAQKFNQLKTIDCSSKDQNGNCYKMIILQDRKKTAVIFEPNESILEAMYIKGPRKIIK